jgi:signal peptidase I
VLYVDGVAHREDYLLELGNGGAVDMTVPPEQMFLMGDNRGDSYDSRELGCFATDREMGKVVVRIFPFSGIRTF